MAERILIIDDDRKLTSLLSDYLSRYEFKVLVANTPKEGLSLLRRDRPALVVLDLMLPETDGFTVCKQIRESSQIPILMLSARGEVTDKVLGLEIGADDYLAKPFEPRELVARIQTILRRARSTPESSEKISAAGVEIDFSSRTASLRGKSLDLTTTEFELLALFLKHPGKVLSRDEILDKLRGIDWEAYNRSVDVAVSRLRKALDDDPKQPKFLKTVRGTGYLFAAGGEKE